MEAVVDSVTGLLAVRAELDPFVGFEAFLDLRPIVWLG